MPKRFLKSCARAWTRTKDLVIISDALEPPELHALSAFRFGEFLCRRLRFSLAVHFKHDSVQYSATSRTSLKSKSAVFFNLILLIYHIKK